jgi:hypothetical protein
MVPITCPDCQLQTGTDQGTDTVALLALTERLLGRSLSVAHMHIHNGRLDEARRWLGKVQIG